MNIGDRVRLIHSSEEGIISKLLDNRMVEVEIEDGFHIPVKQSEVVVIAQEENRQFGKFKPETKKIESKPSETPKITANKGIYVAFMPINDQKYSFYLINNTDFDLPFIVGEESNEKYKGLISNILRTKNTIKITEVNLNDFEKWGTYIFQFLFFMNGYQSLREPLIKRTRFRANSFFKSKGNAPILNKEGYVFQIDQDEKVNSLDSEKLVEISPMIAQEEKKTLIDVAVLKEKMFEKTVEIPQNPVANIKKPALEVDLHIETLTQDYEKLNSAEIIEYQLKIFEKNLENALASGMNEIIFIHGVGNGKLRQEIHRRLSGNKDIKFFQDARKEKFGYGATLVAFK